MPGYATSQLRDAICAALKDPAKGRIITIMGPNGAGKSKLLREVKDQLDSDRVASFILPPVRRIKADMQQPYGLPPELNAETCRDVRSRLLQFLIAPPQQAMPRPQPSQVNIETALTALLLSSLRSHEEKVSKYKTALYEWDRDGGERPVHPDEDFNQIVNDVGTLLGYKTEFIENPPASLRSRRLAFQKDESTFGVDGLSDGEQQLLLVSVFLMQDFDEKFVFLADEPELYLNEARAIAIWEKIEARFPVAVFVHATHNLNFATRPTASATYILNLSSELETVDRTMPLPGGIVRDIVGARIQLARTTAPAIFCEDTLSKLFLSDLFRGADVEIVPTANYQSVEYAVSGEREWKKVRSEGNKYCGIIDRDMRDDADILKLENKGVFCLPLNEVESVLLIPEIALETLSRSARRKISIEEYTDAIVRCAENRMRGTLEKLARHLEHWHSPTINYTVGEHNVTVSGVTTSEKLSEKFIARSAEVYSALKERDVMAILRLFKGKKIYKDLCAWGIKIDVHLPPNPEQRYNDVRDILAAELENIDMLQALRKKVIRRLTI